MFAGIGKHKKLIRTKLYFLELKNDKLSGTWLSSLSFRSRNEELLKLVTNCSWKFLSTMSITQILKG